MQTFGLSPVHPGILRPKSYKVTSVHDSRRCGQNSQRIRNDLSDEIRWVWRKWENGTKKIISFYLGTLWSLLFLYLRRNLFVCLLSRLSNKEFTRCLYVRSISCFTKKGKFHNECFWRTHKTKVILLVLLIWVACLLFQKCFTIPLMPPSTSWLLSNLYVVIFLLQNICGIIWKRTAGLLQIDLLWPQDSSKESWSAMVDYSYNSNIHKPEARGLEPVHGPAWATEGDRVSETNQTKISDKRNKANSPFPSINQIALTFPYTWVLRIAPCCSPKLFASS